MAEKKFSPMRYTASTEAAAVAGALSVVGVSHDEIDYEVIEQSAKGVTVRIKPRSAEAPVAAPVIAPKAEAAPVIQEIAEESSIEESPIEESPIVEDVPELLAQDAEEEITLAADSPAEVADGPHTTSAVQNFIASDDAGDDASDDDAEAAEIEAAETEVEPVAATESYAEPAAPLDPALIAQAQQMAQQFLDKMGLDARVHLDTPRESNTAALIIDGADVGILIGKHGATLQSFQYLLNLTLNSHLEGDGMRVVVDAGNYRARRQSSLEQIARGAAAKARRDARSVRLDPMPAHERRLVHMFLQTENDIYTQSEGREPLRRIVISPATSPRPAAPREAVERTYGNDRPNDRPSENRRGGQSGMGSFARRSNEGNQGGRGFNRGR